MTRSIPARVAAALAIAATLLIVHPAAPSAFTGAAALTPTFAQARPFTPYFTADEFAARRTRVAAVIGQDAVAVLQGAGSPPGYTRFRQTNGFFYLSGIETPHSYLLIDGATGDTTLYLPPRDERRESTEGKLLSADDAALVMELTGAQAVATPDRMRSDLEAIAADRRNLRLFTPFEPAEGASMSRDLGRRFIADMQADPWDGRRSREQQFIELLRERVPTASVEDLSPTLDSLRLIKSPAEIALIRRATDLSGLAILEAMRSTEPGLMEYELDGLAKFIFYRNGAQADAYYSLIAAGTNAYNAHYHAGADVMEDGELLLMDFAPDVGYYAADVTRQWPVNGTFNDWQRELYGFYLAYYHAILDNIRPGDVQAIKRDAVAEMQAILARWQFSKPYYRAAAERFVDSYARSAESPGGSLGHGVGMAVHDVGNADGVLAPGMVFTIEPQFRVPEEEIYIRLEDMLLITEDGAENMSGFVPMDIDGIEAVIAEPGLLQRYPRVEWNR
ncbi:MAG: Xaa-Pro aminopeptidase [Acidobacteriota bacterium]